MSAIFDNPSVGKVYEPFFAGSFAYGNGDSMLSFVAESGATTAPCFAAAGPVLHGLVTKIIAQPVGGFTPAANGTLVVTDVASGQTWSAAMDMTAAKKLFDSSNNILIGGRIAFSIDDIGGASLRYKIVVYAKLVKPLTTLPA